MSAQNPFTQTSFGSSVAGRRSDPGALLGALEALLDEVRDPGAPIPARVQALATFGRRLDTLFEIHGASLRLHPTLAARTRALAADGQALLSAEIVPALRTLGIRLARWDELRRAERDELARAFAVEVSPLLTPLTVDATHPFPALASLSLDVAALVRLPHAHGVRFVGVEVPPGVPRFLATRAGARVGIEDVIGARLDVLLPGLEIRCHHAFRVTRDRQPRRAGAPPVSSPRTRAPVRLELDAAAPPRLRALLLEALDLDERSLFLVEGLLDLGGLATLPWAGRLRAAPTPRAIERLGTAQPRG